MTTDPDEEAIRNSFEAARSLIPSDADVDAVLARLSSAGPSRRYGTSSGVAVVVALVIGVVAVPPVRAAAEDLASSFSGYFSGEDNAAAPGRPVQASDTPPPWLEADGRSGQRILASNGSHELYVVEQPSGAFGFALDDSVGVSDSAQGWAHQFADKSVVVLGPSSRSDSDGLVALFGLSAGNVKSVQVQYESGPESVATAQSGGFIALADPSRTPTILVALDSNGNDLQKIDLSYIDWAHLAD